MPPIPIKVAVVLPPREGFGPGRTGAIGLLVRRLAQTPGFQTVIIGGKQDGAVFPGIDFRPVSPALWPFGSTNIRYAAAVADVLKKLNPALWRSITVRRSPWPSPAACRDVPVILTWTTTRRACARLPPRTSGADLLRRLAGVFTASEYLRQRFLDGVTAPGSVTRSSCTTAWTLTNFPPPVGASG